MQYAVMHFYLFNSRFDVGPPMMGATSGNIRISSSLVNFPTYLTAGIATGTAVTAGINNLSLDVSSSEYTGPPAGAQNGNGRLLLDPTLIQVFPQYRSDALVLIS